jgi:hypothetical protein
MLMAGSLCAQTTTYTDWTRALRELGITWIAVRSTGLFQIPKPLARAEADRLAERYGDRNAVL